MIRVSLANVLTSFHEMILRKCVRPGARPDVANAAGFSGQSPIDHIPHRQFLFMKLNPKCVPKCVCPVPAIARQLASTGKVT